MTAIIRTGSPSASQIVIPASIVTLENLTTWSLRALWQMHKTSEFFPDKDLAPVKRIQRSPFVNGSGQPSILWSVYLTYNAALGTDTTLKDWSATDEISDIVPDTNFNT